MGWGVSVVCTVNLSTAIASMNHDASLRNFLKYHLCLWSSLAPSMEQPHQRLSGERYNTCIYTVLFMHLLSVWDILYNDWSIVRCIITLCVHTVVYVYWLQICEYSMVYYHSMCTYCCICILAADLLMEGANLTALRKNEMHLPKPSKLAPRRNMVYTCVHCIYIGKALLWSPSSSARDWWCLEAPPTSGLETLLHTLSMTTPWETGTVSFSLL